MRSILVISYSKLASDGRVQRQIRFLQQISDAKITVAALGEFNDNRSNFDYIKLPLRITFLSKIRAAIILLLKLYDRYDPSFGAGDYLSDRIKNKLFDLVIVNDLEPLVLVYTEKQKMTGCVMLDAHEYSPLQFEDRWRFRVFFKGYADYLCKRYLNRVDSMITVSEGLKNAYFKNYGARAQVITNTPFYKKLKPRKTSNAAIRLIYHGGVTRSRKIELMFELIQKLDNRFNLDLMLVPTSPKYFNYLEKLASKYERVKLVEPVDPENISEVLNQYDIGVYMMAPVNFNHENALPNKLFEFIQSRIAVALWPTPAMAEVVRETKCGVLSQDYTVDSLANVLNNITAEEIDQYKKNSDLAASKYCAEVNQEKFCEIVNSLLTR